MKNKYIEWREVLRYMNGETSKEEKEKTESWLKASPRHRKYYEQMNEIWNSESRYKADIPKALQQFDDFVAQQNRLTIRRKFLSWSVAAVLFLCLSTTCFFWMQQEKNSPVLPISTLVPGTNKAVLIMDDGTSINLSKHTNTTEWIGNSIKIEREQGKITFKKNASASPTKYYTIRIPRGGEYHTVLEDGTKVWLNAESEIRFPAQFNDNERHIFISGEAYFEVAHNPSQPFIAETDLGKIKVFGTTFNIRWYPKEEEIKTTLIEGSIGFKDKTATSYTKINPGYQISYKQGQATVVEKIKINNEIAWKNRQFCFERQQLANIMEEIARWYNANIIFQDNSLKKLRFTGTLNRYSKIETLLHYLEEGCDLRFQIDGQTITIMRK